MRIHRNEVASGMMNKRNTPFRLAWVPENTLLAICAAVLLLVLAMMPAHAANVPTAIYLDGINGNDASDGSTAALAVRSFARAKELATINQGITTIYISGSVTVSGGVSLAGTNAMLVREPSYNAGVLLIVPSGETATFGNITIDGNSQQQVVTRYSLVSCLGTLNIEDGAVLQNNRIGFSTQRGRGGAIDCNRGTLNMTGGVIQDNQATHGGGILLQEGAVFNMSGGTIQNNKAVNGPNYLNDGGAGGGVCMSDGATFNISGNALIQKNHSEEVGGGISVGSLEASQGHNRLVMTGGQIDQNSSGATGGGIFVQAGYASYVSTATITSGSITNNRMLGTGGTYYSFGGGGIYVNGFRAEGYSNGQLF